MYFAEKIAKNMLKNIYAAVSVFAAASVILSCMPKIRVYAYKNRREYMPEIESMPNKIGENNKKLLCLTL